jgi:hypothetical protein
VVAGLALVALLAAAFVLWPRPERFARENCDRVQLQTSRGAPRPRVMPNGCPGSPVLVVPRP